ncbi:MAG: hypothetical protein ACR2OC_00380 [Solirubrobacterales bacterium]
MGIGDFLRRIRGDRRAMPEPGSAEFQQAVEGSALPGGVMEPGTKWESYPGGASGQVSSSSMEVDGHTVDVSGPVDEQALRAAGVPADSAAAAVAALQQISQAFGGGAAGSVSIQGDGVQSFGNVEVNQMPAQTLDLRKMSGLREQMMETMKAHGVDPGSGQAVDASQVPGLQEAMLQVLANHGIDTSAMGAPFTDPSRPPG